MAQDSSSCPNLESEAAAWASRVEFVDGGTQGLALLG